MNKFSDTVNSIKEDLQPLDIPKEEFLAICAKNRLEYISSRYDRDFDKFLEKLERCEFSGDDLSKIAKSLKRFSETVYKAYKALSFEIKSFEEYFK